MNKSKLLIGVVVLACIFSYFSYGIASEPVKNKQDERKYADAVKRYRLEAEHGNAEAQNNLGDMYHDGKGVEQNYAEAVKWYRLAANKGNADAQYNLALMYYLGRGVNQNHTEAAKWFRLAVAQNHVRAQNILGILFLEGKGVNKNYEEAVRLFRLSAEQGYATAQNNLASMYSLGFGIKQNRAEAMRWYQRAADQGHEGSILALSRMEENDRRKKTQDRLIAGVALGGAALFAYQVVKGFSENISGSSGGSTRSPTNNSSFVLFHWPRGANGNPHWSIYRLNQHTSSASFELDSSASKGRYRCTDGFPVRYWYAETYSEALEKAKSQAGLDRNAKSINPTDSWLRERSYDRRHDFKIIY